MNHIKSLEHRIKELESERTNGGKVHRSSSVSDAAPSVPSSSLSPHPSPVAKFEPDEDGFPHSHADEDSGPSDAESEIDQLIAPTRHLVVSPVSYSRWVAGCKPGDLVTRRRS